MENQSGHPHQHGMANQGFRPFTSSAQTMAQQHASSSVDASASTMMPIAAPVQMLVLPYHHPESSGVYPAEDGYIWKNLGVQEIPGSSVRRIYYECAQTNCIAKKSVALSGDGQIVETVFRGSHNHTRPISSEMWPRDGLAGYGPGGPQGCGPQGCDQVHAAAVGTSMPARTVDGDDQLPSSSESEEDNEGEPRADGDIRGSANDTERGALVPVQSETLDGAWQQNGNSHQRRKRRGSKSSKVWDEFTPVLTGGEVQGAECNHCKKRLSGKSTGGTSHLRRHLKACPAQPATGPVQQQRPSSYPNSSVEKNSNFDEDKSLELLTKALVSNLCSFSLTSSTNYKKYLAGICPTYAVVSQSAIGEKFLSIFRNRKLKLMEDISLAPGGVFLTVSKWNLEFKYFVCVKVHFIDKEWNVIRKIIRFSFAGSNIDMVDEYISMFSDFQSYHKVKTWDKDEDVHEETGDVGIVKEVVKNWRLDRKLLGISFTTSLDRRDISGLQMNLSERSHLLVRNNILCLHCIIDSLREIISYYSFSHVQELCDCWFEYMTCSPMRREKYKGILSQLQINQPSFHSQKWYLVFYLLEAALQFDRVWPNPTQIDSVSHPSRPPSLKLQATEDFCNIARLIYHAFEVASSPYNATLNSLFHTICRLKIALTSSSTKDTFTVFNRQKMQEKFDELWRNWYLWLSLAVILDPRYKFRFLARYLGQAFGTDSRRYMAEVRATIYELFVRYSFQSGECSNESNIDSQLGAHGHCSVPVHEELGELILYLEGECIPENVPFDILKWWKDNASTYPTLARLARDILAIPASGVSAESAFDETDEAVSLFSRKMNLEQVEALICTKDWIKSSEINNEEVGGSRN